MSSEIDDFERRQRTSGQDVKRRPTATISEAAQLEGTHSLHLGQPADLVWDLAPQDLRHTHCQITEISINCATCTQGSRSLRYFCVVTSQNRTDLDPLCDVHGKIEIFTTLWYTQNHKITKSHRSRSFLRCPRKGRDLHNIAAHTECKFVAMSVHGGANSRHVRKSDSKRLCACANI